MPKDIYCSYGCGNLAIKKFKSSRTKEEKWCCSNKPQQCPALRKKNQQTLKDKSKEEWEIIVQKRQETCLEKFGTKTPAENSKVLEKTKETNLERYGVEWTLQNSEIRDLGKETMIERYGEDNAQKVPEIHKRTMETVQEKYGVENISQNEEIKQKKKETCQEHWGADSHMKTEEGRLSLRMSFLQKYGVDNPMKNETIKKKMTKTVNLKTDEEKQKIKNKREKTNIEKFGVHNPGLSPEIAEKAIRNGYKNKNYTLPSGNIIKVRGYEPYALDILFETYTEEQIQLKKIPFIVYEFEGKTRRHFPDIYLPKENKIIEVKSEYTVKDSKVLPKMKAGRKSKYNYEIWVIGTNGQLIEKYK